MRLNSVVMGMQYFGHDEGYGLFLDVLNYIFAFIFTVEFLVKWCAIGWKQYCLDGWNRFDFVIVVGTLLGILIEAVFKIQIGPVAMIVRMIRMGRIFRLVNSAKTLKQLFNTIIASMPSLMNVIGLTSILFFVFAVLGLQMFATVAESDDINEHANFCTLDVALNVLLRFSTGENWNGVMHEMMTPGDKNQLIKDGVCHSSDPKEMSRLKIYPSDGSTKYGIKKDGWCDWGMTTDIMVKWEIDGCTAEDVYDGGYKHCCRELNGCAEEWMARSYFYLFTLVVTFVMLNLVIGIILDAFDGESQEDASMLSEDNLTIFVEDWSKFDEDATYCIKLSQLRDFFQLLAAPMGFGEEVVGTDEQLLHHILDLGLVIREDHVEPELGEIKFDIYDVASALGRRVCRIEAEKNSESSEPIQLEPEGEPYLAGISHTPAKEVITTYFELTYNVRASSAPKAAKPVVKSGDEVTTAAEPSASDAAPSAAAPPVPPSQELALITGPGTAKPDEAASPEGAQT